MRNFTQLLALLLAPVAFGQTNYTINAQGNTWTPNTLTIDMGDSVTWHNNNQGSHNLNGTIGTYPSNPESFGQPTTSSSWTYGYRFNVPGSYTYRCDVHSAMMIGTIVVNDNAGITTNEAKLFSFNPNPATTAITIATNWTNYDVTLYDMAGSVVMNKNMSNETVLDISSIKKGVYLIQISSENGVLQERLVKN